jgi:hypothetical protein
MPSERYLLKTKIKDIIKVYKYDFGNSTHGVFHSRYHSPGHRDPVLCSQFDELAV